MGERDDEQIEGRNPVIEAIRGGHEINKILIAKGELKKPVNDLLALARGRGIPVNRVEGQVLDRMALTKNHQGVIALATAWKYASIEDIMANAARREEPPFILLLDGVEDPQNLGSIIRTAEAAGVHGIIIPARRAAGLSAAVARASAGAVEHIPVARATNLTHTIEGLKKAGLWFTGAETEGTVQLHQADLRGPIGVVTGSEGKGISRLVREHCDQIVRLPMWGRINSLNVSVATGIILYEVRRQRHTNLEPARTK
ncbi:MAG: 23S rRNA (guanosine(2251)-2'-O)-methyltransferase RlmB [Firmicutes bacterium]|nr:23S rRNA (guanosine(2251)-2'-O)-methyltransferase RlmB [Bacillota bacterium]